MKKSFQFKIVLNNDKRLDGSVHALLVIGVMYRSYTSLLILQRVLPRKLQHPLQQNQKMQHGLSLQHWMLLPSYFC